jgi:tyrosyl-tRNA synthetase
VLQVSRCEALFRGELRGLTSLELNDIFSDVRSSEVDSAELRRGIPLLQRLCDTGVCHSKSDGRRAIEQGAIYVNDIRVIDLSAQVTRSDEIVEGTIVLRLGKKGYHLIRVKPE